MKDAQRLGDKKRDLQVVWVYNALKEKISELEKAMQAKECKKTSQK